MSELGIVNLDKKSVGWTGFGLIRTRVWSGQKILCFSAPLLALLVSDGFCLVTMGPNIKIGNFDYHNNNNSANNEAKNK